MKVISLLFCFLFSVSSLAAVNDISMSYEKESAFSLEPAITFSSINGGTQFLSMALSARVASWLRLGGEFDLPADFDENAQIYQARLFGRVMLLDQKNKVYLQGAGVYSVYNYTQVDIDPTFGSSIEAQNLTDSFFSIEAMVGYSRVIGSDWSIGGRVGVQYAEYNPTLAASGLIYEGQFYNNRASIYGSYVF